MTETETAMDQDPSKNKKSRKGLLFNLAGALFVLWIAACVALFAVMRQPPETFGRVMAHVPGPAFMLLPFETLWTRARAGNLQIGDSAPDFSLQTLDKSQTVQLSTLASQKPVVLVFGSYT
jgi:AhpC/TSA family